MPDAGELLRLPLCTALCLQLAVVWPHCGYDERLAAPNLHCETLPDPSIAGLCRRAEPLLEDRGGFHHPYVCDTRSAHRLYCDQPLTAEEARAVDDYLDLKPNDRLSPSDPPNLPAGRVC